MTVYATWRNHPTGIPRSQEARERKLAQIRAELERPATPEQSEVDRSRIAEKVAEMHGVSGLFGQ